MRRGVASGSLLLAVLLFSSGCAREILARNLVEAPNRRGPTVLDQMLKKGGADRAMLLAHLYSKTWKTAGAQPGVSIAVAVIEPGDYDFKYAMTVTPPTEKSGGHFDLSINSKDKHADFDCKGTVVLLHGYGANKESMMFWALELAQHGFRAVLVDLRGHGESTGRRISFGAYEADDLMRVADSLTERKLGGERIGVLGVSYGASLGILWAAKDPRIAAMVCLEPYADPRTAIPEFIRGAAGKIAARFKSNDFVWAEQRAANLGGFSWDQTVPLNKIAAVKSPILFYHSENDSWVLPKNSEQLVAAAAKGSKLVIVPDTLCASQHILLPIRLDLFASDIETWFTAGLALADDAAAPSTN